MSCFDASDLELGAWPTPRAAAADAGGPGPAWSEGTVLLTGPAGLLGVALLESMLVRTAARVVCLVRADDESAAAARLESAAAARGLRLPPDRVRIVVGDLARPRLGLDEATHAELAETVDLVIHNGAHVRWWGDVDTIRATNIESLRTILRLAATARPKRVAFMSSVAVFNADDHREASVAFEDPPGPSSAGLRSPYVQSKWAGERLCVAAAERGVPVTIVRVPYLLPDSRRAAFNPSGLFELVLGASVELGVAPDLELRFPVAPVDVCADRVVRIVGAGPSAGPMGGASVHHVVPFEPPGWRRMVAAASSEGWTVRLVPPLRWFEALRDRCRTSAGLRGALALVIQDPTRTLWSASNIGRLRIDDARTRALLPDLPPLGPCDDAYLRHVVRTVVGAGSGADQSSA